MNNSINTVYSRDKFEIIKCNAKWNTITQSFRNNCEYDFINQTILSKGLSNLRTTKQPYVSTSILRNKLLWRAIYNFYAIIYRLNISSAKNISYFISPSPIAKSQNLLITFTTDYNCTNAIDHSLQITLYHLDQIHLVTTKKWSKYRINY